jgi:hypothetical protein
VKNSSSELQDMDGLAFSDRTVRGDKVPEESFSGDLWLYKPLSMLIQ